MFAGRGMRVGVRTFISVDSAKLAAELSATRDALDHLETYSYYPVRGPWGGGSLGSCDTRSPGGGP